jgi:LuxR family transcriptional activator of bioluminescence operon
LQVITDYPEEWLELYNGKDMIMNDPVVAFCQEHSVPVVWSNLIKNENYNKQKYLYTMRAAEKFGLKSGVSVPLKSPSGEFGIFSMSCDQVGAEADEKCRNSIASVQCFASYVLEAVLVISESEKRKEAEDLSEKLTQREYECLFWACEGKTAWEISVILKIKERTVLFHLSNATAKMGASNRQHAVAKALLLGIIKPRLTNDA